VGITDHQPYAREAALLERGDELAPEVLALVVAHLETEQLTTAIGIDARAPRSSGADLESLAQSALEVGGIEVDIGIARLLQWPAQEGLRLLVDVLTDATELRLGDAAL
jgi:hypothetical protein